MAKRPPEAALPEAVRDLYEARAGFANYHFNRLERDRVSRSLAAAGGAGKGAEWVLSGTLAAGGEFRIELSDTAATIDLPTGTSTLDTTRELDVSPEPPGSGGLLAALVLWRRLVTEGPAAVGRTIYRGTAPRDPRAIDPSGGDLVDVLETAAEGVEARFAVDAGGSIVGIDLWIAADQDPCEIRFAGRDGEPARPTVMDVHRGPEPFGSFRIERFERTGGTR